MLPEAIHIYKELPNKEPNNPLKNVFKLATLPAVMATTALALAPETVFAAGMEPVVGHLKGLSPGAFLFGGIIAGVVIGMLSAEYAYLRQPIRRYYGRRRPRIEYFNAGSILGTGGGAVVGSLAGGLLWYLQQFN